MTERIIITDDMREAMTIFVTPSCPVCGDDGDLHDWVERDIVTDKLVNCDRIG